MNQIIPPSFLFQYSLPIPRINALPRRRGPLLQLPDSARLFVPGQLNQPSPALDLRLAWNPDGLGISLAVSGRTLSVAGRSSQPATSDSVLLLINTRHSDSVHRATGFCSALLVLPLDEDHDDQPFALAREIAQQRDLRQPLDASACRLHSQCSDTGYLLEVWIPAAQLAGFQEAPEIGNIGFYCIVHDTELGDMPLSVGGDFPVTFDPSTWLQLELAEA